MIVKLLTEHHLEFLSLDGDCRGSSGSTLVKMSNCWKSSAGAQFFKFVIITCPCLYSFSLKMMNSAVAFFFSMSIQ